MTLQPLRYCSCCLLGCLIGSLLLLTPAELLSQPEDPFDPFSFGTEITVDEEGDLDKSAEELIDEAGSLLQDERPLDARTKLLRALRKNPEAYKAHILLAGYYLSHVGHFRLALRYARQAQTLFEAKKGKSPYNDPEEQNTHAQILYLLAHIRLNLDNYQGALDVLDQYSASNYYGLWYPGTRSWVLMKLNRIPEAIRIARLGIMTGAEPGRTLNMLGILLSMTGERESALQVFGQAIDYELSLGKLGAPATPINNAGEVYKEMFKDDQAETFWLRATSLPDGCEHVLPAINLALLYIEQARFQRATETINSFNKCIAQYPLRNNEEHRALVQFIQGRIAYHTGDIDAAIELLEMALESRQWFGKIGTNLEDLQSAARISLARALRAKRHLLSFKRTEGILTFVGNLTDSAALEIQGWWQMRSARQMLVEQLNNIEDLYIRNTDSMIEYPTFGTTLAGLPLKSLIYRIEQQRVKDPRPMAELYYQAYLAEAYLKRGSIEEGLRLIDQTVSKCRPVNDNLLKIHLLALKSANIAPDNKAYPELSRQIYELAPAALRNYGLRLPVRLTFSDKEALQELRKSAFWVDNGNSSYYLVDYRRRENQHVLILRTVDGKQLQQAEGTSLQETVNLFTDLVFVQKLKGEN